MVLHPLVALSQIRSHYDRFEDAVFRENHGTFAAVNNHKVRGTAGSLYAAIDLANLYRKGHIDQHRLVYMCVKTWDDFHRGKQMPDDTYNAGKAMAMSMAEDGTITSLCQWIKQGVHIT